MAMSTPTVPKQENTPRTWTARWWVIVGSLVLAFAAGGVAETMVDPDHPRCREDEALVGAGEFIAGSTDLFHLGEAPSGSWSRGYVCGTR